MPADPPQERGAATPAEDAARAAVQERVRRVEVEFLERVRTRLPAHPAVVESLGHLYTQMGRYQDGLRADRDLVKIEPRSPVAWYNLACSLSLTGQPDEAFAALEKAMALGFDDAGGMKTDDDLAALRPDPRFARLVARLVAREA